MRWGEIELWFDSDSDREIFFIFNDFELFLSLIEVAIDLLIWYDW